jgi:hypothetical protein
LLCASCAQTELKAASAAENFSEWSVAQFSEALSAEATLHSRLMVLWRFSEVYPIVSRYTVAAVDGFLDLLVRNLGYDRPHPLAQAVCQAAVDACIGLGKRILPICCIA